MILPSSFLGSFHPRKCTNCSRILNKEHKTFRIIERKTEQSVSMFATLSVSKQLHYIYFRMNQNDFRMKNLSNKWEELHNLRIIFEQIYRPII